MINVTDEFPVWVTLQDSTYCDCCKKKHMRQVFRIKSTIRDDFFLGYACAGRWFKLNLSGNKSRAAIRLQAKMNSMPNSELLPIIDAIGDSGAGEYDGADHD